MKALELLKSRQAPLELRGFEDTLPLIYRTFLNNFLTGDELVMFRIPIFNLDGSNIKIRFSNSTESNPWAVKGDRLLEMFEPEVIIEELENYKLQSNQWHKFGMIRIGKTHFDLILLGLDSQNSDQIFLYGNSSLADKVDNIKIAENTFDLFNKIELTPDAELLEDYNISLSNCCKKWGEDFWRIKK